MRKLLSIVFVFLIFPLWLSSQDCCDVDSKLVICYTSQDDYCNPAVCDYTFDGNNMQGVRQKLANMANFGPNGISTCDVETLPLVNINTPQDITDLECDVVYIGSFYTNLADITTTTLDPNFLGAIREWSTICDENLTILFQGESTAWGYEIVNENVNPNVAGSINTPNIFDGPFGSLTTFNQGGSFQANFSQVPNTGISILAEDALGRPTVVLDHFTNDLLLADVGIMCNTAGEVSISPNINNNNDILACNVLALGCEIAGVASFTEQNVFICENASFTLPDGDVVNSAGQYTSTLVSSGDCDSIIITNVAFSIPQDSLLYYEGCDQDGFSVQVGNTIYDQDNNPMGSEILQNIYGCDSLVNVELVFNAHTVATFDTIICEGEPFTYLGNTFSQATDTTLIISNFQNCDSVITVVVEEYLFDDVEISSQIIVENNRLFSFDNIIPDLYQASWTPDSGLSCTNCLNPTLSNSENIPVYNMELTSLDGCVKNYEIQVTYSCDPYIPNIFNPESISGNDRFGALVPCEIEDYSLIILDRWGSPVFQSDDQAIQWDGKLKNDDIVPGVYIYLCEYSNLGIAEKRSGSITVVQ